MCVVGKNKVMKRDLKFRAWDEKYKYMNYKVVIGNQSETGYYYTCHSMWVLPENVDYKCEPHWMNFEEGNGFQVMQYTGIKDKNGKDIYEGDIVETPAGQIATVDYSENHYQGFICNEVSTDWHWNLNVLTVEVIGNIFENPEILEK
jgi:uncharacterized phage protein (TIGR01671 family)